MFGVLKLCGTAVPRDRNGLNFGSAIPPRNRFFILWNTKIVPSPIVSFLGSQPLRLLLLPSYFHPTLNFQIKASSSQAFTEAKQRPPRRVCTRSSESRPTRSQRRSSRRTGAWPSNTTQTRRGRSPTIGFHPDFGQAIPPRRVAVGVRRPDFIQIHNAYATLSDPAAQDFTQIHNTTLSDPAAWDFTQIHNATLSKFTRRWVSNRRVSNRISLTGFEPTGFAVIWVLSNAYQTQNGTTNMFRPARTKHTRNLRPVLSRSVPSCPVPSRLRTKRYL
ncbi:hypothetical protein FF2_038253 [Malus domestica]